MSAFAAILAPLGESLSESFPLSTLTHGTSMSLISQVCTFLSNTSFANVNPEEDWKKWADRDSMECYYFLLSETATAVPQTCLRAIVDRTSPRSSSTPRIVIDYTYTSPAFRGLGLAKSLCAYVINLASLCGANTYVLALEDSCPWWLDVYGFVLESNPNLNARFNVFPDTHLLRLGSDRIDFGHESDLAMQLEWSDDEEEGEDGKEGCEEEEEGNDTFGQGMTTRTASLYSSIVAQNTPESANALIRLKQLFTNAATGIDKYQRINCSNAVVASSVMNVGGCFEFLLATGWEVKEGNGVVLEWRGGPAHEVLALFDD